MVGERGSFFTNVLFNPLVWIGIVLGVLHLQHKTGPELWNTFQTPTTYINLLIGSAIYTALFDRHYTKNRKEIAIAENLVAILVNAYIIFFVWGIFVFVVSSYHASGLRYSAALRERLAEERTAPTSAQPTPQISTPKLNLESGKRYKVTPNSDGSFILEVIEE
ncbi:MAG: hypothetical protein NC218_11415 [Acetobacter sp.]|nr:hypothetical protein [Acetobacter sp.]